MTEKLTLRAIGNISLSSFTPPTPTPRHHVIIRHLLAYPSPPSPSGDDVIYEQPLIGNAFYKGDEYSVGLGDGADDIRGSLLVTFH